MSNPLLSRRHVLAAAAGLAAPLVTGSPIAAAAALGSGAPRPASLSLASSVATLHKTVFTFYYPWYSAPPFEKVYYHWNYGGLTGQPGNIASAFYPAASPYASDNPALLATHMPWIKNAGIDVIVVSWWGQGDQTDRVCPAIMAAAASAGVQVSFQIEPYTNRTTTGMLSDIAYLYAQYGSSPAFYRATRPTLYGPSTAPRGAFFIYNPDTGPALSAAFDSIRGTANDAILLVRLVNDSAVYSDAATRTTLAACHADGLYSYDPFAPNLCPKGLQRSSDYVNVYGQKPGWDQTRIPPYTATAQTVQSRLNGSYYDAQWYAQILAGAENVGIVSFNEWHEGTQIEPATPFSYQGYTYQSYEGAWGQTGATASAAYLLRTAQWTQAYRSMVS